MADSVDGKPMPVLFVGHGNPMNALATNQYTRGWRSMALSMPRPKAILSISAHWYLPGTRVTAMARPRTIHDFGGFPERLYKVEYPAPGDPGLATMLTAMLKPTNVHQDSSWGLDHGTWSLLVHMFPEADVPVVQLSVDATMPPRFHYQLAERLAPLRKDGILVLSSGNIVHNLHAYSWGDRQGKPFDWALEFEHRVRALLGKRDHSVLIAYESLGESAMLSAPTPDHYLPLLYTIALGRSDDRLSFPVEGFDGGSVSMLAVRYG